MRLTAFRKTIVAVALVACRSAPPLVVAPPAPPPPADESEHPRPGPLRPTSTAEVPPPLPLPAITLAEIDARAPTTLEAEALNGAWLVFCRHDADSSRLELRRGDAPSASIDDLLAWDRTGHWLVVRQDGAPWLIDVLSGERLDLRTLGFDDRDDALDKREHRALAFDPRGEVLAYLRRKPKTELVLRVLMTGEEKIVRSLPGEPWRMNWDYAGSTLVVSTIADDTNKNVTLDFPVRLRKSPRAVCSGLLPRFHVTPDGGDRATSMLVSRDGEAVRRADDFVAPFGDDYLARGPDGALSIVHSLRRVQLSDPDCMGRVLAADPVRELCLVSCTNDKPKPLANGEKPPKRVGVELVGPGYRQDLGVIVQPMALDRWPESPPRLVAIYPGSDTMLVDFELRRPLLLRPGDRVLTTAGGRALVRRERSVLVVDVESGTETELVKDVPPFAGLVVEGPLAAVGNTLFDAARGAVVGKFPGRPLALTPSGDGLVPEGGEPSADAFAIGPWRWHRALAAK